MSVVVALASLTPKTLQGVAVGILLLTYLAPFTANAILLPFTGRRLMRFHRAEMRSLDCVSRVILRFACERDNTGNNSLHRMHSTQPKNIILTKKAKKIIKLCLKGAHTYARPLCCCRGLNINPMILKLEGDLDVF